MSTCAQSPPFRRCPGRIGRIVWAEPGKLLFGDRPHDSGSTAGLPVTGSTPHSVDTSHPRAHSTSSGKGRTCFSLASLAPGGACVDAGLPLPLAAQTVSEGNSGLKLQKLPGTVRIRPGPPRVPRRGLPGLSLDGVAGQLAQDPEHLGQRGGGTPAEIESPVGVFSPARGENSVDDVVHEGEVPRLASVPVQRDRLSGAEPLR